MSEHDSLISGGEHGDRDAGACSAAAENSSTERAAAADDRTVAPINGEQCGVRARTLLNEDNFPDVDESLADAVSIQALLHQFSHPKVRADFVNGRFGLSINPNLLPSLDALRWSLFPRWRGGSLRLHQRATRKAAENLTLLIDSSSNLFRLDNEEPMTYQDWFQILESIATNQYWSTIPPEDRCTHIIQNDICATSNEAPRSFSPGRLSVKKEKVNSTTSSSTLSSKKKSLTTKAKTKSPKKVEEITISSSESSDARTETAESGSDNDDVPSVRSSRSRTKRYDRREVIKPPKFKMDGKLHLRDYLPTFEEYFDNKFKGSVYDKTQCLSEFIDDRLLTFYNIRGGRALPYDEMKKQLLSYYKKQKVGGRQFWREKMKEMSPEPNEGYDVFGLKLIEVTNLAYPSDPKESAKQLREHFFRKIPSEIVSKIEDAERALKCSGKRRSKHLPFNDVIDMAKDLQKRLKTETRPVMCTQQQYNGNKKQQESGRRSRQFSNSRRRDNSKYGKSNRYGERLSSANGAGNSSCSHCGNPNHSLSDCWRALKLCLICGKNHDMSDCPRYDPHYRTNSSTREESVPGNDQNLTKTGVRQG